MAIHPPSKPHPIALRLEVRREYVTGHGALVDLAAKHGLPPATVADWSKQGRWSEARRRAVANREAADLGPPAPALPPSPSTASGDSGHASASRAALEAHIAALDLRLRDADSQHRLTADDWHKLANARHRLFEQWRILAGMPLPGSKRPRAERSRPTAPDIAPLGASDAAPVVAVLPPAADSQRGG